MRQQSTIGRARNGRALRISPEGGAHPQVMSPIVPDFQEISALWPKRSPDEGGHSCRRPEQMLVDVCALRCSHAARPPARSRAQQGIRRGRNHLCRSAKNGKRTWRNQTRRSSPPTPTPKPNSRRAAKPRSSGRRSPISLTEGGERKGKSHGRVQPCRGDLRQSHWRPGSKRFRPAGRGRRNGCSRRANALVCDVSVAADGHQLWPPAASNGRTRRKVVPAGPVAANSSVASI